MNWRSIGHIVPSRQVDMEGIVLDQPLPASGFEYEDPFLLIHHWKHDYPGGQLQSEVGVGPHPHRGFSPVTLVFKGSVHHRDSLGHEEIIHEGGVQWMNSGRGILHSERPSEEIAKHGGEFEIVQFWVNVPKAHKMDAPNYYGLEAMEVPTVRSGDGKVANELIAGFFEGNHGKIKTLSDLLVMRIDCEEGGEETIPIPDHFNAILYVLDGELLINGITEAGPKELVCFRREEGAVYIKGHKHSRALLLAGEPLNEKVAMEGPFVMNEHSEVLQAMQDYKTGKMGSLVESFR